MLSVEFWLGFAVAFGLLVFWGRVALSLAELRVRRRRAGELAFSPSSSAEESKAADWRKAA